MEYTSGPPTVPRFNEPLAPRDADNVAFYTPGYGDPPDESAAGESQAAELVSIFGRNWLLFVVVFVLVLAAGTALVLSQRKSYTAETTVLFDPRDRQVVNFTPVVGALGADSGTLEMEVATELQLIQSRRVTDPVIAQFNLMHDSEFTRARTGVLGIVQSWFDRSILPLFSANPPPSEQASALDERRRVLKAFADRLKVQEQGHSTAMQISFTAEDAQKAAAIANAIAANYVQVSVMDKSAAVQDALNALTKRSAELKDRAIAAQNAVEQYRNAHHLVEGSAGNILSTQISEFSTQLVQAESDLAAAQARLAQVGDAKGGNGNTAAAVIASPLIAKLRELEATERGNLAQQESGFGDRYPGVAAHRSNLAALRDQINGEISNIVRSQHAAVDAAQERVNLIKQHLADIWKQAETDGDADVHLRQLKLEASVQYNLYESQLRRVQEISQEIGTAQPYAEVISAADAPELPSWPDLRVLLPAVLLIAGVFATVSVVCAEMFSRGFRTPRQVAQMFGDRQVELVPNLTPRHHLLGSSKENREYDAFGPYAEAIHALRVRLHYLGAGNQTLLFCSALAKEGKTSTAVAFARQEAMAGTKVLMIDADLRRPNLHRIFKGELAGLSEVLLGQRTFDETVQRDEVSGLSYLAAGNRGTSPIDLLASAKLEALLNTVAQRFDRIVIDSPPVLSVADARVLTALANRTMYIVRWGSTPRRLARLGYEVLRQSGGKVLGPIFINVDAATTPYSSAPVLRGARAW